MLGASPYPVNVLEDQAQGYASRWSVRCPTDRLVGNCGHCPTGPLQLPFPTDCSSAFMSTPKLDTCMPPPHPRPYRRAKSLTSEPDWWV